LIILIFLGIIHFLGENKMDKNSLNEIKNNINNIIDDIDKSLLILKSTIDYLNNEMKKI